MATEASLHKLQHIFRAATQDVDVLYGVCLPLQSVTTCLLRLPNKLIKVYITAKHFGNTSRYLKDTGEKVQEQAPANKSSATARLAHFLADPSGIGSFDTTCLVTHDWKQVSSQRHDAPVSKQSGPSQPHHKGILQAVLQQGPSGCTAKQLRNPWLAPVVAVFSSTHSEPPQHLCLVQRSQHNLADALRFSPAAVQEDALCRLILFQVLSCLHSLHSQGLYLGHLTPDTVWLTADRHLWLDIGTQLPGRQQAEDEDELQALTCAWCSKRLSNLDYLLRLNSLAGRRYGDPTFHPFLPWVLDMTEPPEPGLQEAGGSCPGWRDLTQTKWRLSKGDEQLDFTYQSAPVPHHISDEAMSELAVCIYKARRLPKEVLVSVVRPQFQPQEYPASLTRLYNWSPDEAIPEFYSDASVFESIHPELLDLTLPDWAASSKDFVTRHRMALESDRASSQLHKWIDLNFGYKLSGQAAVEAKNVALPAANPAALATSGRVQLFHKPHPPRRPHTLPDTTQVRPLEQLEQLELLASSGFSDPHLSSQAPDQAPRSIPAASANGHDSSRPEHALQADSSQQHVHDAQQRSRGSEERKGEAEEGCAGDIHAVGRLMVQLFRGKMLHHRATDHRFWLSEVAYLPWACRTLATACLQTKPSHRPTAAALLECDFFQQPVRTAAFFLAALHPSRDPIISPWDPSGDRMGHEKAISIAEGAPWLIDEATGCGPLAALAARAASGELAALQAQPDALSLCLPAFTSILSSTLDHLMTPPRSHSAVEPNSTSEAEIPPPVKGHSALVQHWCLVVRVLVDTLRRRQTEQHLVSLLVRPFVAQHSSAAAAICVAILHLMPTLFDNLGLDTYMSHFHPHLMHMIMTSANQPNTASSAASQSVTSSQVAASFERAQMTNAASTVLCAVVGNKLTLPVVLEHVIRPLLLALGNSPDVAVALIGVGGAIGGAMTALHVLPSLIMVLLSSSVSKLAGEQAPQRMPSRRRISEGGKGGAGAMLNAVTALEGLLPILPAEAVRQQVVRARQVFVQPAMLAEAPSLSAAAAGGPAEETQPSLLADMLLNPLHHPLATPQLRDRLAALLLQACKLVGGNEVVTLELLPQLVPMFLCPPDQRGAYGSSIPPANPSATQPIRATTSMAGSDGSSKSAGDEGPVSLKQRMQQALTADIAPSAAPRGGPNPHSKQGPGGLEGASSMQEEDTGFWDLVYILYPDFAEGAGVGPLRELIPHWSLLERTLMARYAWAPPAFNPNLTSSSSSGLLASLKDKVKRIRRTTSGASVTSPHSFPTRSSQPYSAPSDDQAQGAALYIEGIGWSTPAAVSPRVAPAASGPKAVGSSPLARESSIMPDWSFAEGANNNNNQGRADTGNGAGQGQDEDEGPEEGSSFQGSLEGSAVRAGADLDAESSVNSLLGPTLEGGVSPLLMEHQKGGPGLMSAPSARRWHWLPVSPDDDPTQWAQADIWERYPLPGDEEGSFWQRPWRLRAGVLYGWRAHRQRLTAIAAHPNELLVATAGRCHVGGQDQEVVRCWNLADAAAGVQYTGHSSPITALCWLPALGLGLGAPFTAATAALIASCDAAGTLHIWSAATGAGKLVFREPSASPSPSPYPPTSTHPASSGWSRHSSVSQTQPRGGLSAVRTSKPGPGSAQHTQHAATGATAVEGSSKSSSSLATALAQRPAGGYSALAGGQGGCGEGQDLVAGTANGRARWIDVEQGMLKADLYCRPLTKGQTSGGVACLATSSSQVAAGLTSGHAAVLDARSGTVAACWKAHDAGITRLAIIDTHQILSSSQDQTLKLWDVRMSHDALHVSSVNSHSRTSDNPHNQQASSKLTAGGPGCLAVFSGHTEPVSGFAIQRGDVIAHAGGHLGVLSLQGPPFVQQFVPTRLTNSRGGKDFAGLIGLDILPHSRLLVAGTEDGVIKICH